VVRRARAEKGFAPAERPATLAGPALLAFASRSVRASLVELSLHSVAPFAGNPLKAMGGRLTGFFHQGAGGWFDQSVFREIHPLHASSCPISPKSIPRYALDCPTDFGTRSGFSGYKDEITL